MFPRLAWLVLLVMAGCSIFGDIDADEYRVDAAGGAGQGGSSAATGGRGGQGLGGKGGGVSGSPCRQSGARFEIDVAIAADADDAAFTESDGGAHECLQGCFDDGTLAISDEKNQAGFRFVELGIPAGAAITGATLHLYVLGIVGDGELPDFGVTPFVPGVMPFHDFHDHQEPSDHAPLLSARDITPWPGEGMVGLDATESIRAVLAHPSYRRESAVGLAVDLSGSVDASVEVYVQDSSALGSVPAELTVVGTCP